jgi:hypothetical protein
MSATYNKALTSSLDKVRFLIHDTDTTSAQLDDDEINAIITLYGSYKSAAVACCESLAAKYAGEAESKRIGNLSISFSSASKKYATLADILRRQVHRFVVPYLGGQSKSDKEINLEDDDNVQPFAKRDIMKHPGTIETGVDS